jgi:hypothetical protein
MSRKEVDPLSSLVTPPQEPARPAAPKAPTPAELAKILAKAAVARAGAPTTPGRPAAAPVPTPAPPRPAGLAAAPPPKRSLSAADAMDAARRSEEERVRVEEERRRAPAVPAPAAAPPPAEAAPRRPDPIAPPEPTVTSRPAPTAVTPLTDAAQAIAVTAFPGAPVYVGGAWYAEDRKLLTALWKSHRARFAGALQLDQAAAVAGLLTSLQAVPARKLVACHAVTDRGDFLVWMDLQNRVVLAAFPNARPLFAGLEGV